MPKRPPPLNSKLLEKWRPDPSRTLELADGLVPGLRVRISPSGVITWSLTSWIDGTRRRISLGEGLGLAEARRVAQFAKRQISDGIDPAAAKVTSRERRKAAKRGEGTLGSVIIAYFSVGPGKELRSAAAAQALIEMVFANHLKGPALDIRPAQLQLAADAWRSASTAARAVAFFRPLAAWAFKRELLVKGFNELEMPSISSKDGEINQRVLSLDELKKLLEGIGYKSHDLAARFMLLTAARREEVIGAKWSEIDLEGCIWTIPAARRKDTRAPKRRRRNASLDHVIPLSRQAHTLIKSLKKGNSDDLIFIGNTGSKLTNWARWSANIEKEYSISSVTPHCLRRTTATIAGELGCAPHLISAILGHRAIGGSLIAGYNKSRFTSEVGEWLQKVADHLEPEIGNDIAS